MLGRDATHVAARPDGARPLTASRQPRSRRCAARRATAPTARPRLVHGSTACQHAAERSRFAHVPGERVFLHARRASERSRRVGSTCWTRGSRADMLTRFAVALQDHPAHAPPIRDDRMTTPTPSAPSASTHDARWLPRRHRDDRARRPRAGRSRRSRPRTRQRQLQGRARRHRQGKILRRFPLVGGIDVAGHVVASTDPALPRRRRGAGAPAAACPKRATAATREYARLEAQWTIPLPTGLTLREA